MMNKSQKLQTIFTKNRSEELGYDVWENFVIPPFFDLLDIYDAKKPRFIIGGRGCGKTMLLRYLSHYSTFSPKRLRYPEEPIRHIGLYWRADTHFLRALTERGLPVDVWHSAFNHLLAIDLGMEVLQSVKSVAHSKANVLEKEILNKISFTKLTGYDSTFGVNFDELVTVFEQKNAEFEMWVNNARSQPLMNTFLPGNRFLKALITCIQEQIPELRGATYFVYIDEYENLLEYQQRIINTFLKHSEPPLIFNIAMKLNGLSTPKTVGEESIVDIADYRTHDLDQLLTDNDFPVFAAEILFLHIAMANFEDVPIDIETLRDPSLLTTRKENVYKEIVLHRIREIFPGFTHLQLAEKVFNDSSISKELRTRIEIALSKKICGLKTEHFYRPHLPQASIITPALLSRSRLKPEDVAHEMDLMEKGEKNRFMEGNWIHNNFVGCLLSLYKSSTQVCPFYAGFDTFCLMSRGNLRHFLELCHRSINQILTKPFKGSLYVATEEQATAARQASAKFLSEVRVFGDYGNQLHTFVMRMGSLLALAHEQPTQSEPERSHFAIVRGAMTLAEEDLRFLREARKWSVLFEEEETKIKSPYQPMNYEYILNPIYSPFFNITYRKRRKLEIKCNDFLILTKGNYEEVRSLLKKYSKEWSIDLEDANPTLFSHLQEVE